MSPGETARRGGAPVCAGNLGEHRPHPTSNQMIRRPRNCAKCEVLRRQRGGNWWENGRDVYVYGGYTCLERRDIRYGIPGIFTRWLSFFFQQLTVQSGSQRNMPLGMKVVLCCIQRTVFVRRRVKRRGRKGSGGIQGVETIVQYPQACTERYKGLVL